MPGFSMPGADTFQEIVEAYAKTKDGQEEIKKQVGAGTYTRQELMEIGKAFLSDVEAAFLSVLKYGESWGQGTPSIGVGISKKTGTQSINIKFTNDYLFRPSFEIAEYRTNYYMAEYRSNGKWYKTLTPERGYTGTGRFTGSGIKDIFALVSSGYGRLSHVPSGLWYGHGGFYHALPQRTGTPFIPAVVAKYRSMYPNVTIEYPPEWG